MRLPRVRFFFFFFRLAAPRPRRSHYNDSLVSRADPSTVVSSQAYVLFYKRKAAARA